MSETKKTPQSTIHTVLTPVKVNHTPTEIDCFISVSSNGFIMVEAGPEDFLHTILIRIESIIAVEQYVFNKHNYAGIAEQF